MSALKLFTVANLRYQLSWEFYVTLLYSPTDAAPQFLKKRTPFIDEFSFGFTTLDQKRSMCDCWVKEEADGKKRQELKELFVPDIIKFLFNRLPRTAIFTEFQKLCEQNQERTQWNFYAL